MSKETGGPAFPNPRWEGWGSPQEGMTLRDYFAAEAVKAFIDKDDWQSTVDDVAQEVAFNAYAVADAMLEAREQ